MSIELNEQAAKTEKSATPRMRVFVSNDFNPPALAAENEDADVARIVGSGIAEEYNFIKMVEIYNGTTSYTPTSGVRKLIIECWGAGGAGGNATSGSGFNGVAGGGGGGAYSLTVSTVHVDGAHTVSVGAGGTVAALGANPGNAGGDTIFYDTIGTIVCKAKGGNGGGGAAFFGGITLGGAGGSGGASSGGVGTVLASGCPGTTGICTNGTAGITGRGGSGFQGNSGARQVSTAGVVNAFSGYGAGGQGGMGNVGGAGKDGLIRVWEFI